ncbi:MAG: glycoside hydrolase family 26 protein [Bacteroidales bacterium]|nr:glycoside hydrolase family 26 protein [Bacteroidales bacterium]
MIVFLLQGCGGGGNDEPPVTITPTVERCSITDGSEQAVKLGSVSVEYSVPVSIKNMSGITLEGETVSAIAQNKVLTVSFGDLDYETDYILKIESGAVVNKNDGTPAGAFSLNFRTEKYVYPNPELPATINWNIDPSPVNPSAGIQAVKLYSYLKNNFGRRILSGTMANFSVETNEADWVYEKTGKYPAITCFDFINSTRDYFWAPSYDELITNAEQWWNNGGIVACMWHWRDPSGVTDQFYCQSDNDEYTTFDAAKIFDTSSDEYKAIISDIDTIAGYLKQLQEKGIPVLWRPMHEAEGSYRWGAWFWWGNGTGDRAADCVQLWKVLYDRLVNYHKLNNLIWVWTVSLDNSDYLWYDDIKKWYPGDDYVDFLGIDIYDDNVKHGSHIDFFKKVASLGNYKKMVTLAETGYIPDPDEMLSNGDKWSYFMTWNGDYTESDSYNGADYWKKIFDDGFVVTRDLLPDMK